MAVAVEADQGAQTDVVLAMVAVYRALAGAPTPGVD